MAEQLREVDPLALESQFCFLLYALSRKITQMYRPVLEPLGLTYPQYLVMLVLWDAAKLADDGGEGLTVRAIGSRLLLDSGTLTPLLKRLAAQGLVCRQRSARDEREVRISLTDAGRALREQACVVPTRVLAESGFTPDQVHSVQQSLLVMLRQLVVAD